MVSDAVMLMLVGMGVVFVFLALLNIAISLLTYYTREHTRKEETTLAEAELARRKKKKKITDTGDRDIQTAVVSAAVHAYKSL
jgi:oxaloacetate decarboxylase (Na+ extruding) subunit gamma